MEAVTEGDLAGHAMAGDAMEISMVNQVDPNHQTQPAAATQQTQPAAVVPEILVDDALPPLPVGRRRRRPNANGSRRTSPAWLHFNKLTDEPVPTAACKYCHKKYLCDSKSHGTSNMLAHSKVCHKNPDNMRKDPRQTNLTSGEGGFLVPMSQRYNAKECRKALVNFVILDEHPFRVVEGEGFKLLCRQLQPQMTIPSRRTVARDCYQLYLAEKLKLKAFLKSDCTRAAITTDCWTSIQNLNYMAITVHFIDNQWKYQKRIISFALIPNHKGETIGKKVEEVLKEWGIRNVSTITVDNASSNDVVVSYLKKRLKNKNSLLGEGDFFHMRCAAHVLNLVVMDGLKDQDLAISSVRNAVRFVRSSPQRALKFKECVEISRITCKKNLCLDVSTRWNSTYMMLDAAEKFQTAFEKLEGEDSGYLECFGPAGAPTPNDWEKVRAFVSFLRIFYEATKVFSSSQEVSIHAAFHNLASILCELQKATMDLNTVVAVMASEMKSKYDKYWGNVVRMNQFLYFGVIFDPRFKFEYIEWSFNDMYGVGSDFAKERAGCVKDNLFKLYNLYKYVHERDFMDESSSGQTRQGSSQAGESALPKNPSLFARADAFKQHLKEKDTIDQQNELERYLSDPCERDNEKFDILIWWKQNSLRYPVLAVMVREILATPVSSVASESAFSTGGRVLDTYRSSLSPTMAEALICTQNWLKPSFKDLKDLKSTEEYEEYENVIIEVQQLLSGSGIGGRPGSVTGAAPAAVPAV